MDGIFYLTSIPTIVTINIMLMVIKMSRKMTIEGKPCIVYTEEEHEKIIEMVNKQKDLITELRRDMNAQRTSKTL